MEYPMLGYNYGIWEKLTNLHVEDCSPHLTSQSQGHYFVSKKTNIPVPRAAVSLQPCLLISQKLLFVLPRVSPCLLFSSPLLVSFSDTFHSLLRSMPFVVPFCIYFRRAQSGQQVFSIPFISNGTASRSYCDFC